MICLVLHLASLGVFASIVASWCSPVPGGTPAQLVGTIERVSGPALVPIRRVLPVVRVGPVGIDPSPVCVLVGLCALQMVLC